MRPLLANYEGNWTEDFSHENGNYMNMCITVKPIKKIIDKYLTENWCDPFAGENSPADITNDIEGRGNQHQMDALEFLKSLPDNSVDGCLFDPPYSTEQCLRRYTPKQKGTAGRAEYWAKCKDEIKRIVKPNGTVISFCWDSTGIGKKREFEIVEILLVCHGACHNDTIITIEKKREGNFNKSFSPELQFETE
jgi:tRNA1(Val) A37 N6-methylase TrmN6